MFAIDKLLAHQSKQHSNTRRLLGLVHLEAARPQLQHAPLLVGKENGPLPPGILPCILVQS